ncbi:hypothetical protein [Nocardia brasiliensis]|uniref:hypothetical protein n=1 Tax=Nocardia brasiliensis TaxID=37326 RepID=UPI0036724B5E
MDSNIFGPIVLGVAAGVGVFAALFVWVEYDPWDRIALRIAATRLTGAERAQLARMHEQRRRSDAEYRIKVEEYERNHAQFTAKVAAGFNPDLLGTVDTVDDPRELDLWQLVAEIEHAEHIYRHADYDLVYPHREALYQEFQRRDAFDERVGMPRVERLRMDLARDRVNTAYYEPFRVRNQVLDDEPATVTPAQKVVYPDFPGPDLADPENGW